MQRYTQQPLSWRLRIKLRGAQCATVGATCICALMETGGWVGARAWAWVLSFASSPGGEGGMRARM
eukprot:4953920-Alexandrium_andersonii.AAC.1